MTTRSQPCGEADARSRFQAAQKFLEVAMLLEEIADGGKEAAKALRRLIDIKDSAQYGMTHLSRDQLKVAMRQAELLVKFSSEQLRD